MDQEGKCLMWTDSQREILRSIYIKFLGDVNNTTDDIDSLTFVSYLLEVEVTFNLSLPETIIERAVFSNFTSTEAKIIELLNE